MNPHNSQSPPASSPLPTSIEAALAATTTVPQTPPLPMSASLGLPPNFSPPAQPTTNTTTILAAASANPSMSAGASADGLSIGASFVPATSPASVVNSMAPSLPPGSAAASPALPPSSAAAVATANAAQLPVNVSTSAAAAGFAATDPMSAAVHVAQGLPLASSPLASARPNTSDADKIVLEYLRKRGFKPAVEALQQQMGSPNPASLAPAELALEEAQLDDDLRNVVLMLRNPVDLAESDVRRFEDCYAELRDWVDGSIDVYKHELHAVLYPLLVHCFLEMVRRDHAKEARAFLNRCAPEFTTGAADAGAASRRTELSRLAAIASPHHLRENETATLFRSNRYEIHLSYYAFELIISFLADDPRRSVLLRILNQRCRVRLDASIDGTKLSASGFAMASRKEHKPRVARLVADDEHGLSTEEEVLWGRLAPEQYIIPDEDDASGKAKPKAPAEKGKGGGAGDAKQRPESTKKDSSGGAASAARGESAIEEEEALHTREDGTLSRSKVPLKMYRVGAPGLETVADRKNRAKLRARDAVDGVRKDLAILCYTFTNTSDDGLNCSAVSGDGSQIAAGFGDSTIRLWDAKASGTEGSDAAGLGGRPVRLIGHSGPVYSVDWSPCARFVLSGSEDGSVRLWHSQLKTDLVAYRGHNYPVWTAAFSPLGHYFSSGSHDRTARVWTTDRLHPLRILAGHLSDIDITRWHPNCNYFATGSSDRTTRLWDVRDAKCARVFHHAGNVQSLAFSPDGRTLACSGDGTVIDIWDLTAGKKLRELRAHSSTVWSLDYSRDGSVLASGGEDWRVCVWRAEDWSRVVPPDDLEAAAGGNGLANGVEHAAGNDVDGDGDAKMDGGDGDVAKKDALEAADDGDDAKKRDEGDVEDLQDIASSGVPEVEKFDTKETPIHCVKFTRRNVLVVAGKFGT